MPHLRLALATSLLTAFLSVGCKQDNGDRCEQPSDCASGFCGGSSMVSAMTSAMGRICSPGPSTGPTSDASPTGDAAIDHSGGDGAMSSDATADEAALDASDAKSDASDAAPDASGDGAATETDGAADASGEAAPGG